MGIGTRLLEHPTVYRLWQSGQAEAKLRPVLRHNDMSRVRRVLDVACGPGTNTPHFLQVDYLGVDLNARYIEYARRRHGREFLTADVRNMPSFAAHFDFVLVNSFFHHVDDDEARRILASLRSYLDTDGHLHVVDMVLPDEPSLARLVAQMDRGRYARRIGDLQSLLGIDFEPVHFETYPLTVWGVTLWNMVYFKGRPRG